MKALTTKNSVILLSSGMILLGIYYFYLQYKQNKSVTSDTPQDASANWDLILKRGSSGQEVRMLQKALNQLEVDGDFGELTEKRLQKIMGVKQTSLKAYNAFMDKK